MTTLLHDVAWGTVAGHAVRTSLIHQIPEALGANFVQAGPITLRADACPKHVSAGDDIEEDERTRFKLASDGFCVGRREDAVLVAATLQSGVFVDADRSSAR